MLILRKTREAPPKFAQKHFNEWKFCSVQLQEDSFRSEPSRIHHKTYMCSHKYNYFVNFFSVNLCIFVFLFFALLAQVLCLGICVCQKPFGYLSILYIVCIYSLFLLYTSCTFWRRFPFRDEDSCISRISHRYIHSYKNICIYVYLLHISR